MPKKALHDITPGEPGWVDALIRFHRDIFGDTRMEVEDEDAGADNDEHDADEADDDGKDALGDAGKRALDAMKAKWQGARNELRQFKALGLTPEQIQTLKAAPVKKAEGDDDAPDLEKIRADAKAEAAREALHGRVEDKIEAKAAKFADPEDVVAILLRSHEIEDFIDDGKVDVDAVTEALKELGEKKPHLLAQGKRFEGGADGGTRKPPAKERPKTLGDAVASHYSSEKE